MTTPPPPPTSKTTTLTSPRANGIIDFLLNCIPSALLFLSSPPPSSSPTIIKNFHFPDWVPCNIKPISASDFEGLCPPLTDSTLRIMFRGKRSRTVIPISLCRTHFLEDVNAWPQPRLFGNCACIVCPINHMGNEHTTILDRLLREAEGQNPFPVSKSTKYLSK